MKSNTKTEANPYPYKTPYCLDVPMDYVEIVTQQWNFLMLLGAHHPFAHNYHELVKADRLTIAIMSDWKLKKRPSFQSSDKRLYLLPRDEAVACTLEAYFDPFFQWVRALHESDGCVVSIDLNQYPEEVIPDLMTGLVAVTDHPRDWDIHLASVEQAKTVFDQFENGGSKPKARSLGFSKAQQWVYFIEMVGQGKVKIGTTGNVNARLAQLQTSSPYQLKLLAVVDGNNATEKQYHKRFEQYRVSGEWYELTGEFEKFIKGLLCIQD